MIQEFFGEFMFHPAPLELSGNTCSHNCCYCFANIRKQSRYLDLKAVIRQINKQNIVTYKDNLIKEGYPICISNKTDPFSDTNYIQTLALAKELTKIKNGIFIQTKGGNGIDEFIKITKEKKVAFYITITTLNETIRKRIEPNAPTTEERFQLAQNLKELGYLVVIAINPILEEWMSLKDIYVLLDRLKKIGINHICLEALHLNKREVSIFSEYRKKSFNQSEIDYSVNPKTFQTYVKKVIPLIQKEGFEVMKLGMPFKTHFFDEIRKLYTHIFPNQLDIINFAHDNGTGLYSFDSFYEKSVDNKLFFEKEFKQVNTYILKNNIHVWAECEEAKKVFSLKEVLRFLWNNNKMPASLQRNQAFRTVVVDKEVLKDKNNNIYLYFDYGIYPTERIINYKTIKNEKVY
jgi:DNA repair photolyase